MNTSTVRAEQVEESFERFEDFFAARYEPLLRAMYLLTGDRDQAEELAQEACVRVCERWDRLRATANPSGYAYRVAVNAYRSRLRRAAVAARKAIRRIEPDPIGAADERDAIRRALAQIPDGQRVALVLMDWIGTSDREAGELLGISAEAARMRASRARQRLRDLMARSESDG